MTTEQRAFVERVQLRGAEIARCNLVADLKDTCASLGAPPARPDELLSDFVKRLIFTAMNSGKQPSPAAEPQPLRPAAAPTSTNQASAAAAAWEALQTGDEATDCGSMSGATLGSARAHFG